MIGNYRLFVEGGLGSGADSNLQADASLSLFELVSLAPSHFAKVYAQVLDLILKTGQVVAVQF